jgi:hypothetical protein
LRLSGLVDTSDGALVPLGQLGADPEVAAVITTDLLDPRRYLTGAELVLTGLAWWRPDRPGRSRGFVAALVGGGAVALAAGEAELGFVPDDLVEACAEAGMPLLAVPVAHSFATITDRAGRLLSGRDDLAAVLARHRGLIAAATGGSGLAGVLELVATELDLGCWVLSPTGRLVAGPTGREGPDEADRQRLARQFLRAQRLPEVVTRPRQTFSLVATSASASRVASWVLVVAGDHAEWNSARRTAVAELASIVALERDLARRRSNPERLLATALARTSAEDVEMAVRSCGLDPTVPTVAVVGLGRLASVVLAEMVVGEVLLRENLAALADGDGESVALLAAGNSVEVVERLRATLTLLEPGLGAEALRLGVSDPVTGGAGLLGATAEARAAAVAADPGTPHSVTGPDRLSSHALLLAAVPAELRAAYRARVLGPLLNHDRLHRTELVRTLRAYLDCSGSWSRCASLMHLHVNTLRYRMERIESLTGRNLRRLEDQADLLLALNLPAT